MDQVADILKGALLCSLDELQHRILLGEYGYLVAVHLINIPVIVRSAGDGTVHHLACIEVLLGDHVISFHGCRFFGLDPEYRNRGSYNRISIKYIDI